MTTVFSMVKLDADYEMPTNIHDITTDCTNKTVKSMPSVKLALNLTTGFFFFLRINLGKL